MASTPIKRAPLPQGALLASPRPELPELPQHVGSYVLERLIGEGGSARVYFGRCSRTNQPVAFKLLRRRHLQNKRLTRSFLEQGERFTQLKAPHLVEVLEVGESALGAWWAMRWVEGEPLSQLLARGVQWGTAGLYHLTAQCASALGALHEAGVTHGDLKPENLIFQGHPAHPLEATLTLLDPRLEMSERSPESLTLSSTPSSVEEMFESLSGELEHDDELSPAHDAQLSLSSEEAHSASFIFGTPAYMSPEHLRGEPLTPASDLYSLGVLLYRLSTGVLPFQGTLRQVLEAKLHGAPLAPSVQQRPWPYPVALESLILNLISRQAEARCQEASTVLEVLSRELKRAQRQVGAYKRAQSDHREATARAPYQRSRSVSDWLEQTAPGLDHHPTSSYEQTLSLSHPTPRDSCPPEPVSQHIERSTHSDTFDLEPTETAELPVELPVERQDPPSAQREAPTQASPLKATTEEAPPPRLGEERRSFDALPTPAPLVARRVTSATDTRPLWLNNLLWLLIGATLSGLLMKLLELL